MSAKYRFCCAFALVFVLFANVDFAIANEKLPAKFSKSTIENQLSKSEFFIKNKGQWPDDVLFMARRGGMNAWITRSGVVYDYYKITRKNNKSERDKMLGPVRSEDNTEIHGHVVRMTLYGANTEKSYGSKKKEAYHNYFLGNDSTNWASFVPLYGEVRSEGIYDGIDMRYYFDEQSVRYDYIIHPGADPDRIRMNFEGQDGLGIDRNGELIVRTSIGEVKHCRIFAYQESPLANGNPQSTRKTIPCEFKIYDDGTVGFKLDEYDRSQELVIDPIIWSTFLGGGESYEHLRDIALDGQCNPIVIGFVNLLRNESNDFPVTEGAYKDSSQSRDGFIAKLKKDGSDLIFATYFGGSGEDGFNRIRLDSEDNIYVGGWTDSYDFPITPGVVDSTFDTRNNLSKSPLGQLFMTKFNKGCTALRFSTFLYYTKSDPYYFQGGNAKNMDFVLSDENEVYVFSNIAAEIFIDTVPRLSSWELLMISKLNQDASEFIFKNVLYDYSIFKDHVEHSINSILLDEDKNIYICGITFSDNIPVTRNAFDSTFGGGRSDVFISKYDSTGMNLLHCTYLGGDGDEYDFNMIRDSSGNLCLSGTTEAEDYPETPDAIDIPDNKYYPNDDWPWHGVISIIDSSLSEMIFSSYFGDVGATRSSGYVNSFNHGNELLLDKKQNMYLSSCRNLYYCESFPINGECDSRGGSHNYWGDVFLMVLTPDKQIAYSSYFGGVHTDSPDAMILDENNNVIIAGNTDSYNFPTTKGAFQYDFPPFNPEYRTEGVNPFITKLSVSLFFALNPDKFGYCPGDEINVPFRTDSSFNTDNVLFFSFPTA